jgi:outer membrane immunogenic protein
MGCQIVPGGRVNASGFFGGGQAGYNLQMGQYVLGSETDFQGSAIAGSPLLDSPGLHCLPETRRTVSASTGLERLGFAPATRGSIACLFM